jgi:hypothetical protein
MRGFYDEKPFPLNNSDNLPGFYRVPGDAKRPSESDSNAA